MSNIVIINTVQTKERSKTMFIRKSIGIVVVITVVCFLAGCGGGPSKVRPVVSLGDPMEQAKQLGKDIDEARSNQVDIFAPTSFVRAEAFLAESRKGLSRGDKPSVILQNVENGRAQLKIAEGMTKRVKDTLPDLVKARDLARAAGGMNFQGEYTELENQFLELTKEVEVGNLSRAQRNQSRVAERFRGLELQAIKEQNIGEARKLISQAEKEGARKNAPKTLLEAKKKLAEADAFITKNRYQKEKIHTLASDALLLSGRALQVTLKSNTIRTMRPEDITLWVEGMLHTTANSLSAPDMRDKALETQVENILGSITALQEDHRFMMDKVKAQNAEKRFNQLFSEVRGFFDSDEAEVYKEGSKLVIRLKAIRFPVGKYVILPNNYSLLTKVQRAIRTFGEPDVIIEGHTDSTGSEVNNQLLSENRAEAVRSYLVANKTLSMEKIDAAGYGSKRPLASNKTAKGRAINRRIDVIITPRR
jgi:outer membrane protein OmpA-like peptidoglycan-associated protein